MEWESRNTAVEIDRLVITNPGLIIVVGLVLGLVALLLWGIPSVKNRLAGA